LQVQVSCSKEFPDEVEEPFILYLLAKQFDESAVLDCVKAGFDIAFKEPIGGGPFAADFP
jgi:hypothetical protein